MDGRMMLGEIVAKVCCPRFLEMAELALYGLASEISQWKCMSMDLGRLLAMLLVMMPCAVVLSVCMGEDDCLWPIYSRACWTITASQQLIKRAASLTSVEEDMTTLMIWAIVMTAPLFGGVAVSLDMKKCPLVRLQDFDLER